MDVSTGATAGAGATSGAAGAASAGKAPGWIDATTPRAPLPCGNTECVAGKQICCLGRGRRGRNDTCVPAGTTCPEDTASIACVDRSACGAAEICCESLLSPSTECSTADACLVLPGVIICSTATDCPSIAPHCCPVMDTGVCSAQPCPAGGDMNGGGNDGPGDEN
jgi:hypothetical protein